jgi:hypothetical protein
LSDEPVTGAEMDLFGNDDIAQLLRLKRYEQPPASYYENFLSEFRLRQRDELRHQPLWSICIERAQEFAFRHNVRLLAAYPAGIAAVVACTAVILITIYQQPEPAQVTLQSSPVPAPRIYTERELDLTPPAMIPSLNVEPTLLPGSRNVPVLPADPLRFNQFVPLKLEWESLDDHSLLREENSAAWTRVSGHPRAVTVLA